MDEARRQGSDLSRAGARPLRILHCPTDVGGNPTGLARAERALGATSMVAVFARSNLAYEVDIDLDLGERKKWSRLAARLAFAALAAPRYDVFHFNFGQTLLPRIGSRGIDLPLLRALGKKIIVTFQGCDARQTGYCRANLELSCCGRSSGPGLCRIEDDAWKAAGITYATRHAHKLLCVNPDLLRMAPGAEFVPYASVDPARVRACARPAGSGRRLTILHAPTNRAVKGTAHVLAAKEALAPRFPDVEWLFVENVPHAEAMTMYDRADLVIDQLRVGWYGALAVELMAMGRPVVCYIREDDLEFIPPAMAGELPIVNATPDTLIEVLARLLSDRSQLAELGARSRGYVERWHDPITIARRMLAIYEDPTRSFWALGEGGA